MAREISEDEFAALENEHGLGDVVVLNVGEDHFAFKRYGRAQCVTMLRRKDEGAKDWLEFAARYSLLCPAAPAMGQSPGVDAKRSQPERAAMMAERARLTAVIAAAPLLGDILGGELASICGYRSVIEIGKPVENKYTATVTLAPMAEREPFDVELRRLSYPEYSAYRDKQGTEEQSVLILGTADAPGIFGLGCIDEQAADIAARYPFLAVKLAQEILQLGTESRLVSLKKYGATTAKTSTTSPTEPPATPL